MTAQIRFTDRSDGDLRVDAPSATLERRRRRVHPARWNWLEQVHGATTHRVRRPGEVSGAEGDALVTRELDVPVSVQTADCAPVVLVGPSEVAVCHVGWRGLLAGVLEEAVRTMEAGPADTEAHMGPLIRAADYEFAPDDLDDLVSTLGPTVRASTSEGRPAFDLAAAVSLVLDALDVGSVVDHGWNTASAAFFSHRVRADIGRQSAVAWLEAA